MSKLMLFAAAIVFCLSVYCVISGVYASLRGALRRVGYAVATVIIGGSWLFVAQEVRLLAWHLSFELLIWASFCLLTLFIWSVFLLLKDVVAILILPFKINIFKSSAVAFLALGSAFAITAIGMHNALRLPQIVPHSVNVPLRIGDTETLHIVFITDLHIQTLFGKDRTEKIVDQINSLNPDLILIGGDITDFSVERFGDAVAPLAKLKARLGVWAVEGNHEHFHDYENWLKFYQKHNINILQNQYVSFENQGFNLTIVGLTDRIGTRFNRPAPHLQAALSGAPEHHVRIGLIHQPKTAYEQAIGKVDLALVGHTHGGQMPLLDRWIAQYNNGLVRGAYFFENTEIYVSEGTAMWAGFPLRMGTQNEITFITLTSQKK